MRQTQCHIARFSGRRRNHVKLGLETRVAARGWCIDHMVRCEELIEGELGADPGMLLADKDSIGFLEQLLLDEVRMQPGEVPHSQV